MAGPLVSRARASASGRRSPQPRITHQLLTRHPLSPHPPSPVPAAPARARARGRGRWWIGGRVGGRGHGEGRGVRGVDRSDGFGPPWPAFHPATIPAPRLSPAPHLTSVSEPQPAPKHPPPAPATPANRAGLGPTRPTPASPHPSPTHTSHRRRVSPGRSNARPESERDGMAPIAWVGENNRNKYKIIIIIIIFKLK